MITKVEVKESDLTEEPRQALKRYNQENGDERVLVFPKRNELFIDIDNEADLDVLHDKLKILERNGQPTEIVRFDESRTPGHYHVVVRLKGAKLSPTARVAFQACLGSDRSRELLSLLRIGFKTNREATVFFEKPDPNDDIPF